MTNCTLYNSAAYEYYILRRYARRFKISIGKESYQGHCLFVRANKASHLTYVVESRACETGRTYMSTYDFSYRDRVSKHEAFRLALTDLDYRTKEPTSLLRELLLAETRHSAKYASSKIGKKVLNEV